jgi:hypothetical protein
MREAAALVSVSIAFILKTFVQAEKTKTINHRGTEAQRHRENL